MKKILVAIDLARSSGNDICIKTAHTVAGTMGGTLILLHVIEPIPKYIVPSMPSGLLARQKLESEEAARRLAKQYNISDVAIREGGGAATTILAYASEINADLIVLNSRDPGLAEYFLGSVASRVVCHAHCSVYVVRHPNA